MKIKKINKIKDAGILQNFDCSNLAPPNFNDINLIFGWNGTGKTMLSRVFRCYELGETCTKLKRCPSLKCDIELDNGSKISEKDFTIKQPIRVFNKDFVEDNIFQNKDQEGENIKAFCYLGKEEIELTKEREEKNNKEKDTESLRIEYKSKVNERDKLAHDIARKIKDTLLGIKEFQYYHKDNFIESFNDLKSKISEGAINLGAVKISVKNFDDKLKTVKNFEAIELWIKDVEKNSAIINSDYIDSIAKILEKTVSIKKTIEKLEKDWKLSNWVQQGIAIHKDRESIDCEFCGQKLPNQRIEDLEQHFNKDYIGLVDMVDKKIKELEGFKVKDDTKIPNIKTKEVAKSLNNLIDEMISKVKLKQKNILTKQTINLREKERIISGFKNINKSVSKIGEEISNTAKALEISLVAENFNEYEKKNININELEIRGKNLKLEIENLDKLIKDKEQYLKDFKLPAKEINEALEKFLGHPELKFDDREGEGGITYYEIKRNGEIAYNLSEGEKTAISLIYFLKKLKEDGFELDKAVVFIDDPVSSMDSQFLYSAYAFIVSAIEEEDSNSIKVGQFFLSTHNYDFLNLFKKKYGNNSRCNLYMLKIKIDPIKGRCSNIYELDKLLKKFNSDYQFLYSLLIEFENAKEPAQEELMRIYFYPNIARRVLEVFLSFKYPAKTDMQGKINAIPCSEITKEIKESVFRFINMESHGAIKEMEGFSSEILEPTAKNHILNVLKIIRKLDLNHSKEIELSIRRV